MVGQLEWHITLGRFEIQAHVITMSRVREQPRQVHLEKLKRIHAYVIRTKTIQRGLEQQNRIILDNLITSSTLPHSKLGKRHKI